METNIDAQERQVENVNVESLSPDRILQMGFVFRSSKALLSAVELGLFAALNEGPLGPDALTRRLGLHARGARDFFDALVALGLLHREPSGHYRNVPDCALVSSIPPCLNTSAVCWST